MTTDEQAIRRGLEKQRCKVCWSADGFDFTIPDEIWKRALPACLHRRVVCLACFDYLATVRGVDYAPHLKAIYFAGEKVGLTLDVRSWVPLFRVKAARDNP